MKLFILFYALLLILLYPSCGLTQILNCPKADELDEEMKKLNADYKLKTKELKAGLYCSQCGFAKSEIEKIYKIPFEEHLTEVSGKAIPASQEMLNKAEEDYHEKFERVASQYLRAKENCKAEADRIAKEEADRIAKEEADRVAKAEAEQKEADRLAKEEAERIAKEEADRIEREEAERIAREEAERIAREEREAEIRAFVAQEQTRLAEEADRRKEKFDRLIENAKNNLSSASTKVIGGIMYAKGSLKNLLSHSYNEGLDYSLDVDLEDENGSLLTDYAGYFYNWKDNDLLENLINIPIMKKVFKYGQEENIKDAKHTLEDAFTNYPERLYDAAMDIGDISNDSGESESYFENLPSNLKIHSNEALAWLIHKIRN